MGTVKLYDADAYATSFQAEVLSCTEKEAVCNGNMKEKCYEVVLNQTLFFPEEGGQTPDKGRLGDGIVFDVQIKGDTIYHYVDKCLTVGCQVEGEIDWQHRFFNMQQHSGEHIFSGIAYRKYGYHNVGFHLSNQIVTMDFDGTFSKEDLEQMEWEVNEAIVANAEIKTWYPSKEELQTLEYRSKLALEDDVRIVEIVGYDSCACCAPHVHHTGEIGVFKIQSAQNYKGGMRLSFLCGFRALEEYRQKAQIVSGLTGILSTNQDNLVDQVEKQKNLISVLKVELAQTKQQLMSYKLADISKEQKNVILFEQELDSLVARNTVNALVEQHEGVSGIFIGNDEVGYRFIIGSKCCDCREIASQMRQELDARGGGSAQMVQGSVGAKQDAIMTLFDK